MARLHPDNGARLERLDTAGDRSVNGMKQSHGLMVHDLDVLHDRGRIDSHHEDFTHGDTRLLTDDTSLPLSPPHPGL